MQPHTGAIITLLAQLRYDIGDSYYKVDCAMNNRQYQITLHDVYRHQLILRVGNIYPCYTKVHLEVGGDFSIESTMQGNTEVNFLYMRKECHLRIEHSHSNIVSEKYKFEFDRDTVWIRKGEYDKENGARATFEGRYEAAYRRSELKDTIYLDGHRTDEVFQYTLP
ncbi:MAG: hypothetical protein GW762_04340 [Candidatus Pacebacteria bacterium]|nr:hypothetical protein [Candidatus Paceibacterota bacterium]PIR63740.1 MAG: hypothetical protein COU64_02080 [Candidatus Pacebacteria bacterium CG10_big_fil_rev_8_21_14_0_10_40_26]PIZ78526.1 MAG: hypothetical protein COY01_04765 [Candidatus Pacebacteria bacterium CG_4_10_14_0_2_um_filter_40_20]PJA69377.1 MAG: hypothetical protein CO156_00655 [Candidatus Pacebacteria bacterium CG_4_9_14_3_um_filter_40_12]PJC41394.1 MAG: hypothetical protein CO041_04640 [Candidatus Pacebacteria bacterium CG_4_9_